MNIDVNMNEINSVEQIISTILIENDFNKMNNLVDKNRMGANKKNIFSGAKGLRNTNFVSIKSSSLKPFLQIMSESEFFKIVGVTKKGLSKRSGRYQEYLYGHYLKAVEQQDEGYISDILYLALEFQKNLDYVKSLMKNKSFVREWRKDFATETALKVFKHEGNLRIVNIVKERTGQTTK